jgi:hypothetical protein
MAVKSLVAFMLSLNQAVAGEAAVQSVRPVLATHASSYLYSAYPLSPQLSLNQAVAGEAARNAL